MFLSDTAMLRLKLSLAFASFLMLIRCDKVITSLQSQTNSTATNRLHPLPMDACLGNGTKFVTDLPVREA